jgi:hypothetical protein
MTTDDSRPTTVAAVIAERRKARDAEAQRKADAQARGDNRRPPFGTGTT